MLRSLVLALVAAPALAAAQVQVQVQVSPSPDAPVVTLSVQETTEVAPDLATVTAGVETIASTAAAALQANSTKMRRVLDAVRAAGVPDRDIRTNTVGIAARYDYQARTRVFQGYAATNNVVVLLRKVADIGPFLDRVTAAGATDVNGPTFAVDQPDRYRATARDRALARAGEEAQTYARNAGFARARLLSVTEGGSFVQPYDVVVTARLRRFGAAPPPPRVSTETLGGQQSVGVSLSVVYRLER